MMRVVEAAFFISKREEDAPRRRTNRAQIAEENISTIETTQTGYVRFACKIDSSLKPFLKKMVQSITTRIDLFHGKQDMINFDTMQTAKLHFKYL